MNIMEEILGHLPNQAVVRMIKIHTEFMLEKESRGEEISDEDLMSFTMFLRPVAAKMMKKDFPDIDLEKVSEFVETIKGSSESLKEAELYLKNQG